MDVDKSNFENNLKNVFNQSSLQWIFVGGKGGVGKTTVSSSLAIKFAENTNEKVLIISTDPAHNLSDAFDLKLSHTPTQIKGYDNLYGIEIDPKVHEDSSQLNDVLGFNADKTTQGLLNELTTNIPGIDEAMTLGYISKMVNETQFSKVIFDTAPTGHTLRLLNFPKLLCQALEKMISMKENFGGVMSTFGSLVNNFDEVFDKLFRSIEVLKNSIETVSQQFKNNNKTTFVAVCIPEFLSIYETERLIQELFKYEIDIRNIVLNQVLFACEDNSNCKMCNSRRKMQEKYLKKTFELYDDFHITLLPLQEEEVRGVQNLKTFSNLLLEPKPFK